MPYIDKQKREELKPKLKTYCTESGELNFQITCLLLDYIKFNGKSYKQVNDVLGALEGAKLEFYRRFAAPYEDKKINENGDVYKKD
jgi:hypothetical protein